MKKNYEILGKLVLGGAFIFLLVFLFVETKSGNEPFARDIFGFPLSNPPEWIGMIPYVGSFIEFVYYLFSIHGLVGIIIFGVLASAGLKVLNLSKENDN